VITLKYESRADERAKDPQNTLPTFVNSEGPIREKSAECNRSNIPAVVGKLQGAFLVADEYQECLALWVRKGEMIWRRRDKTEDRASRQKVVSALKIDREAMTKILNSMHRSKESERDNLRTLLEKAGNDPLMFLNLAGVPPLTILGELQYWNKRHMILQGLRKRVRSNATRKQDVRDLKNAARVLEYYRPLLWNLVDKLRRGGHRPSGKLTAAQIEAMSIEDFEKEIAAAKGDYYRGSVLEYEGFQVPREYPSGQYLLAIAKMIEIETPGMRKNGAPKVDFSLAVKGLFEICQSKLAAGLQDKGLSEETESYITLAKRALFGFITALLMGSFPEWFCRQENPVRNVKNAYRVKRESYL
jgi:hypothetical protein